MVVSHKLLVQTAVIPKHHLQGRPLFGAGINSEVKISAVSGELGDHLIFLKKLLSATPKGEPTKVSSAEASGSILTLLIYSCKGKEAN